MKHSDTLLGAMIVAVTATSAFLLGKTIQGVLGSVKGKQNQR